MIDVVTAKVPEERRDHFHIGQAGRLIRTRQRPFTPGLFGSTGPGLNPEE